MNWHKYSQSTIIYPSYRIALFPTKAITCVILITLCMLMFCNTALSNTQEIIDSLSLVYRETVREKQNMSSKDICLLHCQRFLDAYEIRVNSKPITKTEVLTKWFRKVAEQGSLELCLRQKISGSNYRWFRIDTSETGQITELPFVEVHAGDNELAYVRWRMCQKGTAQQIISELNRLTGLKGIVVDVRGNPGGHLLEAALFAEQWVSPNTEIMNLYHSVEDLQKEQYWLTWKTILPKNCEVPIVFITDGGTASTAEALVAILKAQKVAVSIGQPTKGDALAYVLVKDKTMGDIKHSSALIKVPDFSLYHNRGISPDYFVPYDSSIELISGHQENNKKSNKMRKSDTFDQRCQSLAYFLLSKGTNSNSVKNKKGCY